jgi:hypothetical protein
MGYGDSFGVNDPITREQIATLLFRYIVWKGNEDVSAAVPTTGLEKYADYAQISEWALDSMKWTIARGIITGRTTESVVPKGMATRAEAAEVLRRFIERAE